MKDIRGLRSFVYIGGFMKTESDFRRIPLSKAFPLKMNSDKHIYTHIYTDIMTFANFSAFGSYHATGVIDHCYCWEVMKIIFKADVLFG